MTCHASSTAMFQSLQEKPKSLNGIFVPQMSRGCENPSLTKDPRQLQFEADVNRLFLYFSYNQLEKNADELDVEKIIEKSQ